jgi:hypothetical protein
MNGPCGSLTMVSLHVGLVVDSADLLAEWGLAYAYAGPPSSNELQLLHCTKIENLDLLSALIS